MRRDMGNLGQIRWLAILLPAASVGALEFFRHQWGGQALPGWVSDGWTGNVFGAVMVAGIVYGFVRFFAAKIHRSALEAAKAREEAAVVLERQRIAREMHDNVAQTLFYLTIRLRETSELVWAGKSEAARAELEESADHLKEAHQQVRTVISDLKQQADLEDFGEACRRTISRSARRLGMRADCEIPRGFSIPDPARQHLLAIVQEALANARHHGHARRATVRAWANADGLSLEVEDDGSGFDPEAARRNGGYGLTIMAERARMAGGELLVDSSPGRGTRLTVYLSEESG